MWVFMSTHSVLFVIYWGRSTAGTTLLYKNVHDECKMIRKETQSTSVILSSYPERVRLKEKICTGHKYLFSILIYIFLRLFPPDN